MVNSPKIIQKLKIEKTEQRIPFVPAYDLEKSASLSDQEIAAVGTALLKLLPDPASGSTLWGRAARIEMISGRS